MIRGALPLRRYLPGAAWIVDSFFQIFVPAPGRPHARPIIVTAVINMESPQHGLRGSLRATFNISLLRT